MQLTCFNAMYKVQNTEHVLHANYFLFSLFVVLGNNNIQSFPFEKK